MFPVPDEVENMRFDDVYDTSIKVLWNPPKNINGRLKGYTLIYGQKNQTVGQTQRDLGPSTLNFTITGLRAQTVYTIKLFARTRVGNGAAKLLDIKSGEKPGTLPSIFQFCSSTDFFDTGMESCLYTRVEPPLADGHLCQEVTSLLRTSNLSQIGHFYSGQLSSKAFVSPKCLSFY
jgi:hypothetical protein